MLSLAAGAAAASKRRVKPDGLPSELTQQIPELADYGYAKLKDQILLVNAMTGEIVEMIPETQAQTTGQK